MISVHALDYRYRPSMPFVLEKVSAQFAPGTMTALTGVSGSGKSTLLYLLALLLQPVAGEIHWQGQTVHRLSDGERAGLRAQRAGFIFQDAMLDPARSVLDNVLEQALFARIPRKEAVGRAQRLLEEFGVEHRLDHKPGEISGGQAQRVALCRALLGDPQVIFGDEPTGNLDDESAQLVWGALRNRAAQGATVIVATHDMRLADLADQRLVLS